MAICAAQRKVSAWWVVSGAPKRTSKNARIGVARRAVSVRESRAGYSELA
jgi:hypothetical protein